MTNDVYVVYSSSLRRSSPCLVFATCLARNIYVSTIRSAMSDANENIIASKNVVSPCLNLKEISMEFNFVNVEMYKKYL